MRALRRRNCDVAYVELQANYGHDSFLVDVAEQADMVRGFLSSTFEKVHKERAGRQETGLRQRAAGAQRLRHHQRDRRPAWHQGARPGMRRGRVAQWLAANKGVQGRGVEISGVKVQRAIGRGVSVYQGDIDEGLADYPDQAFDYVILSQTLQETLYPRHVLQDMLRVGRRVIVAFPNFGHWTVRYSMLKSALRAPDQAFSVRVVRIPEHPFSDRPGFRGVSGLRGSDSRAPLLPVRDSQSDSVTESAGRSGECI